MERASDAVQIQARAICRQQQDPSGRIQPENCSLLHGYGFGEPARFGIGSGERIAMFRIGDEQQGALGQSNSLHPIAHSAFRRGRKQPCLAVQCGRKIGFEAYRRIVIALSATIMA